MSASTDDLERLAESVKKLRREYEKYFMGLERLEPIKLRDDVKKHMRRLMTEHTNNTARRFRLQTLQATLVTYEAHWNRICREIEEGTFKRDKIRAQAILDADDPPPAGEGSAPVPRPEAAKATKADTDYPESVRKLHEVYEQTRLSLGGDTKAIPIAVLAATVQKQVAAIKAQYNCKTVEFKVAIKDGKPILKAVPK